MPLLDVSFWNDRLQRTLTCYDDALLRPVVGKLCRPRSHWPTEELIERGLQAVQNAAVIDRRLADLPAGPRRLLALIGHSRQPRWPAGSLVEATITLGDSDGLASIITLLEAGLIYPEMPAVEPGANGKPRRFSKIKRFDQWLTQTHAGRSPIVFAHPSITARAMGTALGLSCPDAVSIEGKPPVLEADGLEWPLRLAALWQQVQANPLRRTQIGEFFKRDLERLRTDSLLTGPLPEGVGELPDPGLFLVGLALAEGILSENDGEIRAATFPRVWEQGLWPTLASLWSALPLVADWNVADGWRSPAEAPPGNPYPAANLLAMMLLGALPANKWVRPETVERWVLGRHPFWRAGSVRSASIHHGANAPRSPIASFLLGLAYPLRLLQAAGNGEGGWMVRLSAAGRCVLGLAEAPPPQAAHPQTLLVQPNLEILAYRQGLTPQLIARLSRLAAWQGLGPACTLQLQPQTVYRALESGETFDTILQTLHRHGAKALPTPVVESIRTWANKRERISVYPSAALFEFASAQDLQEALARGVPAVPLTDRLAVVARESDIDYRHFRLTGTRDYALPPEKCVAVESDGVTLTIDPSRSDLLLESELCRFAQTLSRGEGRRQYRVTPASLAAARRQGMTLGDLETWFSRRSPQPLSPAVRMLFTAGESAPLRLGRRLVLYVPSAEIADGLMQWPQTRELILSRLGPAALEIAQEQVGRLARCLAELDMPMDGLVADVRTDEPDVGA